MYVMNIKKYLISVILATSLIACNNTNNNTDKAKEPEIKKTYTTAEQHQIWKDEITKLVPSGYKIEFNFEKIESMISYHKEAEFCLIETQKNFQGFANDLQNKVDIKTAFETFSTKIAKSDEVCSELVMDEMYGDCSTYSLNALKFFEYSLKGDAKRTEYYLKETENKNLKCMFAVSMYKMFEKSNDTPLQHKLAIFTGNDKSPFEFCESSKDDGIQKHYCRITEFQKAGLVSRFE